MFVQNYYMIDLHVVSCKLMRANDGRPAMILASLLGQHTSRIDLQQRYVA